MKTFFSLPFEMPYGFLNASRRIIIGKVFFKDVYI